MRAIVESYEMLASLVLVTVTVPLKFLVTSENSLTNPATEGTVALSV